MDDACSSHRRPSILQLDLAMLQLILLRRIWTANTAIRNVNDSAGGVDRRRRYRDTSAAF